ncbi:MAG: isochorismate synthase [Calditrichia bacterium]
MKSIDRADITHDMREKLHAFFAIESSKLKDRDEQFVRLELQIPWLDPFAWLSNQRFPVKFYWRDRKQTFETAGIGEAHTIIGDAKPDASRLFERMMAYLPDTRIAPRLRYYGGMRFAKRSSEDEEWKAFGCYRFTVPQFELSIEDGKTLLACNFLYSTKHHELLFQQLLAALEKLSFRPSSRLPKLKKLLSRRDFPDFSGWRENVVTSLKLFSTKQLKKIVMARKTTLEYDSPLNPLSVFNKLRSDGPGAFQFYFQPTDNLAFLGRTPELLYRRQNGAVFSDAIAGTRKRGETNLEDKQLASELLNSDKDVREHRIVLEDIAKRMKRLCSETEVDERIRVLKLARLQHLYATVKGQLKTEINDGHIIDDLHPTPAVGGLPKKAALEKIVELEPFDRGWYAGPVGWVGRQWSEFAVAIRSGLVDLNKLHLYAGAGIVPGSEPNLEWDEIENKLGNFMSFIEEPAEVSAGA